MATMPRRKRMEVEDFIRVLKDWDMADWQRRVVIDLAREIAHLKAKNKELHDEIIVLREKAS